MARGNEKGHVESLVGYLRRNFLVPVQCFASFVELNAYLARRCENELHRTVRAHAESKRERLEADPAALLPFPKTAFESRKVSHGKANSLSLVRFYRNDYSVPTAYAHQNVVVIGGGVPTKIVPQGHLVATHARSWDRAQTVYESAHYLALLERKPGAFDAARPIEDWQLLACFWSLRRRLEVNMGPAGVKEYIKVLRLLERHSLRDLRIAVERAAVMLSVNADVVELLIRAKNETPVELFSLDGHVHLRSVHVDSLDLAAYRTLTAVNS